MAVKGCLMTFQWSGIRKNGEALKAVVLFVFLKAAAFGTILDDELCYMCVCLLCCFFLLFMKGEWGCLKE